jgi:hypothetical protein
MTTQPQPPPSINELREQYPDASVKWLLAAHEHLARLHPPTDTATVSRAGRLANRAVWTLQLQRDRLRSFDPMDDDCMFQLWADLEFFIVTLHRLRKAAELMRKVAVVKRQVTVALREFDRAIPQLATMRDVLAHIDDYATDRDSRHHGTISRRQLEVLSGDGKVMRWLGYEIDVDAMLQAGQKLYLALFDIRVAHERPEPTDRNS